MSGRPLPVPGPAEKLATILWEIAWSSLAAVCAVFALVDLATPLPRSPAWFLGALAAAGIGVPLLAGSWAGWRHFRRDGLMLVAVVGCTLCALGLLVMLVTR